MKYLNTRDVYLTSIKVPIKNEAMDTTFVNETTWGGSLLGRLVNSAVRLAAIGVNYKRVESIAQNIYDELVKLLGENLKKDDAKNLEKNESDYKKLIRIFG